MAFPSIVGTASDGVDVISMIYFFLPVKLNSLVLPASLMPLTPINPLDPLILRKKFGDFVLMMFRRSFTLVPCPLKPAMSLFVAVS